MRQQAGWRLLWSETSLLLNYLWYDTLFFLKTNRIGINLQNLHADHRENRINGKIIIIGINNHLSSPPIGDLSFLLNSLRNQNRHIIRRICTYWTLPSLIIIYFACLLASFLSKYMNGSADVWLHDSLALIESFSPRPAQPKKLFSDLPCCSTCWFYFQKALFERIPRWCVHLPHLPDAGYIPSINAWRSRFERVTHRRCWKSDRCHSQRISAMRSNIKLHCFTVLLSGFHDIGRTE